jgi:uroporphyrinogen decarboxylase
MAIKPILKKWEGRMTDRERFNRQMHFQSIDRCFNMEFGYWDENFTEWPLLRDNGIKNNAEADIFFNFDKIATIGGNGWMLPNFEHKVVEERDDVNVIMNGDGLLAEVPKSGQGSSIPHYLKSSIVTPEDWRRCKAERFRLDHPGRKVDIAKLKADHPDNRDYPLGIWTGSMIGRIRDMLTFEGLAYATFDYPEMVEDMVETCCLLVEDYLDQMLPHFKFDFAAGWEDICFKNGPIVSVEFFRDVVTPRYKRINKKLKAHGIDVWYSDCDGDVRPILPYFMEGGINCLFPFEVMGCAHPGELLDQNPGLRIMGGFDKIQLGHGRKAIKEYMETLVPYVERGGYIPFCDHRCPPNVTPDDYLYYLDLKKAMFGLDSPMYKKS